MSRPAPAFRTLLVAAIALSSLAGRCHATQPAKEIGGGWRVEDVPRAPEAGLRPRNLVRDAGGRSVVVDELIEDSRFYEPDCVVYQTARQDHDLYAVCGDRAPVAIESSMVVKWTLDPDGPRRILPAQLRAGRLVQQVELLAIEEVKAVAMRQPPWRRGARASGFDSEARAVRVVAEDRPVDVRSSTDRGAELLFEASIAGQMDLVDALLNAGADASAVSSQGMTPLMFAATNGHPAVVNRLLDAGANVNVQSRFGVTALMFAAGAGQKNIVRRLLAAGADVTLRDEKNLTALERISGSRDTEMLELLRNPAVPKK